MTREAVSISLKAMGKIQNERQQENRKTTCEMVLARYKKTSFLHRIVTGDEKWINFGKYFRMRLTHKTWLCPISTYLHRWDTHLLSRTSFLTNMYENGSMTGLPQKTNNFFGEVSINCQTDGKNV